MEITAYISINLLLFSAWYIILFRKKNVLIFSDRLTGTFIAGLTQIIATEMLLGVVFEKLYPLPLFLLNISISSGLLIPALLSGGSRGIFDEIKNESARIFGIIRGDRVLLCIFSLFFISVCWLILTGYLFPSYSWDALNYHLPIVGQILQSGAIRTNPTPSFVQQYINAFPINIDLFFLWNIIFLKSDVIVDLGQLFFTLAGVVTVYSMAVKLKIREKYAIYSSLLFFFTPVLILQSTINYVDGAVSMLFLMALNFLLYDDPENYAADKAGALRLKDSNTPLLLSGLAAGILLGSKPMGPLYIVVMLGAILIREYIKHFKPLNNISRKKGERLKVYLIYFIAPVFLIGGYWYIRNWILYGNPVYYVDVSIFNITLFKGLMKDWPEPVPEVIRNSGYFARLFHVWLERVGYYMYDSRLSGFGPVWLILFLPSIIFSLFYAAAKKKQNFLFVSLVLIAAFIVQPRSWLTRYVIFITGTGALSFGLAFDYFNKRENVLKIIALLLAGYTFLTANSPCIMPGKVREFLLLPAAERTLSRHKPFNIDIKVRSEYGYWTWLQNNISRGDTLAYTFESLELDPSMPFFTAPLWNREFSNKVVYIKSDTYREWLKKLENIHATHILIKKGSIEDKWIEKERKIFYSLRWMGNITEKFRIVYADENYKIVRFYEGGRQKDEG
ncbi:MAG TPA: hypothetical protein ENG83_06475 [Nitrospirae bacterium]|nr:hypothetical protein BMS3Abin06_01087 [bacterium BMS3Abin06]HDH11826.1 hypothetical protein [Nitrospirota bacterium]HDZ02832.1 hypothetical protein [Nitrospirota bacterium]